MGGQPRRPSSTNADGDPVRLGILPLPGEWGRVAVDGTTTNGSGTNELLSVDYGVSPSHPVVDQF